MGIHKYLYNYICIMVKKFEEFVNERFTDQNANPQYSEFSNKLRHVTFKEDGYTYNICYNRGDETDYPIRQIIDELIEKKNKYNRIWELIALYLIKFCKNEDAAWRRINAAASYFVKDNQLGSDESKTIFYPTLKEKIEDEEILLKALLCGFSHKQMNVTTQGKDSPDEFSPLFYIYMHLDDQKESISKYSHDKLYEPVVNMLFMNKMESGWDFEPDPLDDPKDTAKKYRKQYFDGNWKADVLDYFDERQ